MRPRRVLRGMRPRRGRRRPVCGPPSRFRSPRPGSAPPRRPPQGPPAARPGPCPAPPPGGRRRYAWWPARIRRPPGRVPAAPAGTGAAVPPGLAALPESARTAATAPPAVRPSRPPEGLRHRTGAPSGFRGRRAVRGFRTRGAARSSRTRRAVRASRTRRAVRACRPRRAARVPLRG